MDNILEALDKITIVFAFITMFIVMWGWYNNYKQSQKVSIYIQIDQTEPICLNISIIRKHLTRSEILGVLGIIQKNSKERYNIDYLGKKEFFNDLYAIQKGTFSQLVIHITQEESKQFILPNQQKHKNA